MYNIDKPPSKILLGYQGEYGKRSIEFDVASWLQDGQELKFDVHIQRPTDIQPYVPYDAAKLDGNILKIPIARTFTRDAGEVLIVICARRVERKIEHHVLYPLAEVTRYIDCRASRLIRGVVLWAPVVEQDDTFIRKVQSSS